MSSIVLNGARFLFFRKSCAVATQTAKNESNATSCVGTCCADTTKHELCGVYVLNETVQVLQLNAGARIVVVVV